MFAIIQTGGKQYQVKEGMQLLIEKVEVNEGETMSFEPLLIFKEEGEIFIGTPALGGKTVTAKVLSHGRSKKVPIIKYKPKVRYRRNVGHRQPYTKIQIEKISG
ncbi:50S ribosomal protein L21 [Candidatus Uhrbacteria bacterium CG_4_9_14_3_um_filter_36_7]|uniref:Large ribosomal subunit protein bL21 n=1 Tax=Candidatus Uhrbacteria bacterium CG_4_9_14_3_um_filter_36_7 TaxID=1975033 RepID=A0A2M7XGG7_9BACT|nr:MAG: 50S ribosomal protein L21 [Candidatus Uhrbacteria bacterium CG_4_9_14_3_um_filter_36_7]